MSLATASVPSFETNQEALQATRDLQQKSLEALERIQAQAAESQAMGQEALIQLQNHNEQLDEATRATQKVDDSLNKAHRLQDRFAFISFQFGNRKTAKRHLKQEQKHLKSTPDTAPTFKRGGPRPIKSNGDGNDNDNLSDHRKVADEKAQKTVEKSVDLDRAELFGGQTTKSRRKNKPIPKTPDAPMTAHDRRELAEIGADDQAIDAGLDILQRQVESLVGLSKTIEGTLQGQATKLSKLDKKIAQTNDKNAHLNHRAKLLVMKRREKKRHGERLNIESSFS